MNKEHLIYHCECGNKIHWRTALYGGKRCKSCARTYQYATRPETNPMWGKKSPLRGIPLTKATLRKISLSAKERFKIPGNRPMLGKHHSEKSKKQMSEKRINYLLKFGTNWKDTDIELLVKGELDNRKLFYIAQYRIKNRIADFYIPKYNLILECDGNYWHNRQDRIIRDIETTKMMEKEGYKVVRLNDQDIKINLINKLTEVLK